MCCTVLFLIGSPCCEGHAATDHARHRSWMFLEFRQRENVRRCYIGILSQDPMQRIQECTFAVRSRPVEKEKLMFASLASQAVTGNPL